VSVEEICQEFDLTFDKAKEIIDELLAKRYIRQDSRDAFRWHERATPEATFYTEPSKRREIDRILG